MQESKTVAIIGAGIMGAGIAQTCAQNGFNVQLNDCDKDALTRAMQGIRKGIKRLTQKGLLSLEAEEQSLRSIKTNVDLSETVKNADIVIEAVPENVELKKKIFSQLDKMTSPDIILATNTSSISITEIASATHRPDKVIGVHFFTPVPLVKGVEVIKGLETSEKTFDIIIEFMKAIGKEVVLSKDSPGFIVNRILPIIVNECFYMLWQNIASAEDIDRSCTLMLQHPIGPLRMADYVGLDTVLAVIEYMHREMGEKYRPCPLLKQLVKAGRLGQKTGRGVYDYQKQAEEQSDS